MVAGRLTELPDAGPADLFAHARQLYRLGRDEDGLKVLRRMSVMDGVPAAALTFLGRKILTQQRTSGAEPALALADRAIAVQPDMGQAHWLRARALFLLERLDQAHEAAATAVRLDPTDTVFTKLLQRIEAAKSAKAGAEDPS